MNLSRCGLTSISGLRSFPSLIEVNLEYNDFTVFDFGDLPEEIKSVALRGNDGITSYVNLMSADGTYGSLQESYISEVALFCKMEH